MRQAVFTGNGFHRVRANVLLLAQTFLFQWRFAIHSSTACTPALSASRGVLKVQCSASPGCRSRGTEPEKAIDSRLQLKRLALSICIVSIACAAPAAFAVCAGSLAFQNCVDESGNNYTVQRFGNTAPIDSEDANDSSTANHIAHTTGSTTFVSGVAADGATWNETVTDYGNGTRTISGMDGHGVVYNRYCTSYGCH